MTLNALREAKVMVTHKSAGPTVWQYLTIQSNLSDKWVIYVMNRWRSLSIYSTSHTYSDHLIDTLKLNRSYERVSGFRLIDMEGCTPDVNKCQ